MEPTKVVQLGPTVQQQAGALPRAAHRPVAYGRRTGQHIQQRAYQWWAHQCLTTLLEQLAQRLGPIVNMFTLAQPQAPAPAKAVWAERGLIINTAAVSANASLMTLV
jgi:delta 1-pyrroline-5-carboxylate dehydrogenase